MTKLVRVENADTSDHKLVVETWAVGRSGAEDVLIKTERLDFPTAMLTGTVWAEQYLKIKEVLK